MSLAIPLADARLLVFDLDGTLIDSEQDLANSINAMLLHRGRAALPLEVIRTYIGDGASMLVRRALGDPEGDTHDEASVTDALRWFLDFYRLHKLDHTRLYPGVLEALGELRAARSGRPMAVLTNKPVVPSREICVNLGIAPFFFEIFGGDSFHTKKPDPTGLLALIEAATDPDAVSPITSAATVMIGDSSIDILTARNAGARAIGCTFGIALRSLEVVTPDALAHAPSDWPGLLL